MRVVFLIILTVIAPSLPNAQQKIRLNDNWEFLKQDIGGIWEAVRPVKKGNPEDMPQWTKINLPHCINARDAVDPDINYYQGPAWYRTMLVINNPYAGGRTLLHFEGAGQKTEVYVYLTKIASHVGGYDEWTVDITDAVTTFQKNDSLKRQFGGKVPVSIRTDNSRDLEMIPSGLSDFNLYGGIYRYLNLVYTPAIYTRQIFTDVSVDSSGKTGRVAVSAVFHSTPDQKSISGLVKLVDPSGKVLQKKNFSLSVNNADAACRITDFIVSKPALWSTENPGLYTIELSLNNGDNNFLQKEKIGFRHFEFLKKGPFKLNGKRLLLRGTHRHEDHAGVGAAMTEDMMRKEMVMMKEMGVNFIRLGHYQQSGIILNLCDSLGILVWEEIPWCRGGLGGDRYQEQARRMLTNMIEQHYNHPSVIIWGLGNENDWPGDQPAFDKERIRAFMKELNDLSHQLDPSRKTAIRRCDFCKDIVDVYSPSIWAGWYRGIYTDYKEISTAEFDRVDHFLHVEWGGDSHAGRHSEKHDRALQNITRAAAEERSRDTFFRSAARESKINDWSETYVCHLVDWHLKEQETMPWLTGTAQWPFKDFSTPLRSDNPVPYMNQKGVVESDLTKKEVYYVFQSYWTTKPMVHIYGHSWPVRWGDTEEEKMIRVYSNCDEAELFVNGKSYGVKKRNSQDFPAAGLRWNVKLNKGKNNVHVIAKKSKLQVKDAISFVYQTEKWNMPAKLLMEKIKEEDGIVTIQAKLLDENDVQCLDAANWIRFELAGDGELMDNLGTPAGSRYVQMYNGRALIRIKIKNGKSVVSARVETVPTAFINL